MVTRIFRPDLAAAATIETSSASVVGYATLAARHVDRSGKAPYELVTVQFVFPDVHLTGSSGGDETAVRRSVNIQSNPKRLRQDAAFWEPNEGGYPNAIGFD